MKRTTPPFRADHVGSFLRPKALLDVGCADGAFLFKYLDYQPELFCGIEASPSFTSNKSLPSAAMIFG